MIRILSVPSSDYLGHPFPQRHNQIFERLNDSGSFEVHVVRFGFYDKPALRTKVSIHELEDRKSTSLLSYYITNSLGHAGQIRRIIRQENIDVVVLSNLSAPLVFTLMDQLSSLDVPIVFDLPDYFPTSAAGYFVDPSSLFGTLIVGALDFALRYLMKHARLVTVPSLALTDYCRHVGAREVKYVPNGIGECFLNLHDGKNLREKMNYCEQDFVIGYVGSIEFWLEFRSLLKGIVIARKKGINAKLLIVGKGLRTNYAKKVEEWICQEGLTPNVTWLDFVPHEEVPAIMAALDMGTIPFDISNPTAYFSAPNKLWEYLSQKKPVVATPIPDVLYNRDCVCLALKPQDYARNIILAVNNNERVCSSVEKGFKKALGQTWKKSTAFFADTIRSVVYERKQ